MNAQEFDAGKLDFDPTTSIAVLIGNSVFSQYSALAPLPEAHASVLALARVLADKTLVGFGKVIPILDQSHPTAMELVHRACQPHRDRNSTQNDCLLIYYCGHGLIDDEDQQRLVLAMRNTHPDFINSSALAIASIKQLIGKCKVEKSIVVLDCCHSGMSALCASPHLPRALQEMARYVVCATGAKEKSWIPKGSIYPAFTSSLLQVLYDGSATAGATITFADVIDMASKLSEANGVKPLTSFVGHAPAGINFAFVRNSKFAPTKSVEQLIKVAEACLKRAERKALTYAVAKMGRDEKHSEAYRMLGDILYKEGEKQVADGGTLRSELALAIIKFPTFREFYNTSKNTPTWELLEEDSIMTIGNVEGDTHCLWKRHVRTCSPLRLIWVFMAGDASFDGFDLLKYNLVVKRMDLPNERVSVVPLELLDTGNRKELVFFLYPQVPANVELEARLEYRWPQLFKPLVTRKSDYWEFRVMSRSELVEKITTKFVLPHGVQGVEMWPDNRYYADDITSELDESGRLVFRHVVSQVATGSTLKLLFGAVSSNVTSVGEFSA